MSVCRRTLVNAYIASAYRVSGTRWVNHSMGERNVRDLRCWIEAYECIAEMRRIGRTRAWGTWQTGKLT
jgi:hypothetical protein